jgi:hypothetical protein
MTLQEKVEKRPWELIAVGEGIKATKPAQPKPYDFYVKDSAPAFQWSLNVLTLLESVFGKGSDRYGVVKDCQNNYNNHGAINLTLACFIRDLPGFCASTT